MARLPLLLVVPFTVLLALLLETRCSLAGEGDPGAPADKPADRIPGFVHVPEGALLPGCTFADYKARHGGNEELKEFLLYEVWNSRIKQPFTLPEFHFGRFEVTNAQWKLYLDRKFRTIHTCGKSDTLASLAKLYVKDDVLREDLVSEWRAIYALNWRPLTQAWSKAGEDREPAWQVGWQIQSPPDEIRDLALPEGLRIQVYRHRTPQHWYGWCRLAGLRAGREYCDISLPPESAFVVPEDGPFKEMTRPLRAKDFAAYPIRDIAPREALAFAEWAGCHLPSEYEFERAGKGDDPRALFTFGEWDHSKQKTRFPWADNRAAENGPLPVDDPSVQRSDSQYGARMMHGNVWELTRTFWDLHPKLEMEPAGQPELANYALIAKGGSFGDGWQMMQLSVRAGRIGGPTGILTLRYLNRADSLGIRLVRHPRPGYDLLLHSRRHLCYDVGAASWNRTPLEFAMERMAGVDRFHVIESESPYTHVQQEAEGVAFAPRYLFTIDKKRDFGDLADDWKRGKAEPGNYMLLGILRSDVPLRGGVRLTKQAESELRAARAKYDQDHKEWKRLPAKKRQEIPEPEKPESYEQDHFERLTAENAERCGLWREGTVAPGEWYLLYWNGFFALANKALVMPPVAIFELDGKLKDVIDDSRRPKGGHAKPAQLQLEPEADRITLRFEIDEQPDEKRPIEPPGAADSSLWALAEVHPEMVWLEELKSGKTWSFKAVFPTAKGALKDWAR